MTNALAPVLELARETGVHVLVTHHSNKKGEGADAILGSTAIAGAPDTLIVLSRAERYRGIETIQRYGEDLPESVLEWNPEERTMSLGGSREDVERDRLYQAIMQYLARQTELVTRAEIEEDVEGRTGPKRIALKDLVDDGIVTRAGTGKRGDPYLFCDQKKACSLVPAHHREQEKQDTTTPLKPRQDATKGCSQKKLVPDDGDKKPEGGKPVPGGGAPCAGTREQETLKPRQDAMKGCSRTSGTSWEQDISGNKKPSEDPDPSLPQDSPPISPQR